MEKKVTIHESIGLNDAVRARGRTDMDDIYIKEAERRVKRAQDAFTASLNTDGDERNKALWGEKQNSLFTIMCSVFTLEAHINRIGHDRLSETKWEDNKRKPIREKWINFPKWISGNTFDKTSQLWNDFDTIVDLRNELVHFKDYDFKEFVDHPCGIKVVGLYEIVNKDNACLAYNTAIKMIDELKKLLR
jgi:hypothetical protein